MAFPKGERAKGMKGIVHKLEFSLQFMDIMITADYFFFRSSIDAKLDYIIQQLAAEKAN